MNESQQLTALTSDQKNYLSECKCCWCGAPLNIANCGATHEQCKEQQRITRRDNCLQTMKQPRLI